MYDTDFDDTYCALCYVVLELHDDTSPDPCAVAEARAQLLDLITGHPTL